MRVDATDVDVKFYSSVTGCPLNCPGIKNAPAEGYSPCGFLALPERSTIVFLLVGADPGPILSDHPVGCRTPESWAREFLENPRFLSTEKQRTPFHREVLRALDEILGVHQARDHFRRVVYTNLVKCSPWPKEMKKAPFETQRTCYAKHLAREIEYFRPLAIIAVGVAKDSSPTTFFENHPPKRSTGEKILWFPLVHPGYRRPTNDYEERRAGQIAAIKRWYQDRVGKCGELAGENDPQPVQNPNVEAEKVAAPPRKVGVAAGQLVDSQVTDTTRITIAARFNRQSAESCLDAVRAARVKCLTAGQELVQAQYDLKQRNGIDPTVAELIAAARRRYTPPRSQEDPFKFWRDYILTNIHRGIFEIHQ